MKVTKIANAAKTFFQTKEEYQAFRKYWAEHFKETRKFGGHNEHTKGRFSSFEHAVYLLLCGRDLNKSFVHKKNVQKLLAGEISYGQPGYQEAKAAYDGSWEPKLEAYFKGFAGIIDSEGKISHEFHKKRLQLLSGDFGGTVSEETLTKFFFALKCLLD